MISGRRGGQHATSQDCQANGCTTARRTARATYLKRHAGARSDAVHRTQDTISLSTATTS